MSTQVGRVFQVQTSDPSVEHPSRRRTAAEPARSIARRGWAWAGLGAAVTSAASLIAGAMVGRELWDDDVVAADNELAAAALAGDRGPLVVYLAASTVAALLLVVFGAGLRRRLAGQCPAGSLLPEVALAGSALAAALLLVGSGISTELFWGLADLDRADPDSIMSMYHLVATLSWVWAGVGLTAAAVAVAGLRDHAMPRWIGRVSAVGAVVVLGFSVIPLQYMSAMFGVVWLLIVSVGSCVSREHTV